MWLQILEGVFHILQLVGESREIVWVQGGSYLIWSIILVERHYNYMKWYFFLMRQLMKIWFHCWKSFHGYEAV